MCRLNQFLPEEPITSTSAFISWATRATAAPLIRRLGLDVPPRRPEHRRRPQTVRGVPERPRIGDTRGPG